MDSGIREKCVHLENKIQLLTVVAIGKLLNLAKPTNCNMGTIRKSTFYNCRK